MISFERSVMLVLVLGFVWSPSELEAKSSWWERRNLAYAKRAFQDSLYDVAKTKLTRFLEKYPESDFKAEALWLKGQCHYFLGENEEALDVFTNPPEGIPEDLEPGYLFWKAEAQTSINHLTRGIETYREFIRQYSEHELVSQARLGISRAHYLKGEIKAAKNELAPLLALDSDSPEWLEAQLQKARILIGTKQYDKALKELEVLSEAKELKGNLFFESAFLKGQIYLLRKDYERAISSYRKITGDSRANPRRLLVGAWQAKGDALAAQDKWSEASEAFSQAFRLALDSAQIQKSVQRYLECQFQNQTLTKGALEVRNFVNKKPEIAVSGLYAIGKYFFLEKKYDAAISELDHLIKQYPDSEWVWPSRLTLADCLLIQGQTEDAIKAFHQIIEESDDQNVQTRARTLLAQHYDKNRQFKKAAELFQEAATQAMQKKERETLAARALFAFAAAKDLDSYLTMEDGFHREFPDSEHRVEILMQKAQLFEESGKDDEARELYSELINQEFNADQTAEAFYRLGISGYESGKIAEALSAFDALEEKHADFPRIDDALFRKIQCEEKLSIKDPNEIRSSLSKWLARFDTSPLRGHVHIYMGNLLKNQGLYAKATSQYRKVIEAFPNTNQADMAAYWGGQSLYELNQHQDAIALLEQVRPSSPWKPNARLAQILSYMKLGDYASGLKIAESVIKDTPSAEIKAFALLRQAECYYTLASEDRSLYPKALSTVEQVIAMESISSAERNEAGFIKGEVYQKLNKSNQALEAFLDVVYGQLLPEEATLLVSQPEFHWFIKSGLAAAQIKETQGDIRGAVEIYRILERLGEPSRREFRRKIEDLKNEHFIYEST